MEYAIIAGAIGVAMIGTVAASGTTPAQVFCQVGHGLTADDTPCRPEPATSSTPSPTGTASATTDPVVIIVDTPSPTVTPTPTPTTPVDTPTPTVSATTPAPEPTVTATVTATATATATATVTAVADPDPTFPTDNSAGTMTFNTAVIDQDQILSCLSIRMNASWYPNNWNNPKYPKGMTVDVTWDQGLGVYGVYPGSNGTWSWRLVEPGHIRLTRLGDFGPSGWQPEPEILLTKPTTRTDVHVTMTAKAPNTATITRTAQTTSWPY